MKEFEWIFHSFSSTVAFLSDSSPHFQIQRRKLIHLSNQFSCLEDAIQAQAYYFAVTAFYTARKKAPETIDASLLQAVLDDRSYNRRYYRIWNKWQSNRKKSSCQIQDEKKRIDFDNYADEYRRLRVQQAIQISHVVAYRAFFDFVSLAKSLDPAVVVDRNYCAAFDKLIQNNLPDIAL